jgi:two-component system LytT family sensor kinase
MFGPMDMAWLPENRWMRRLLLGALVLYGWTIFGILSSAHYFLGEEAKSGTASLNDIAGHVIVFYWAWAALTPLVLSVLRRSASAGATATRRWSTIALGTPMLVLVHAAVYLVAVQLVGVEPVAPIGVAELRDYAMRHAGGDVATVAVLAAVYLLLDARQRASAREVASAALEARLASADLEVLRWQLQPHFLFNALNTVSTLVLKGDNVRADDAIGRISRYLRSALTQRADATVTVADEMLDVGRYFAIERLRFGDALVLEARIDADARGVRIPALLLQPLVENAIRHGLSPAASETRIGVCAAVAGSRLRIRITDPAQALLAAAGERSEGFGLRYVRERLRHFYGDGARVTLETTPSGTTVTMEMPIGVLAEPTVAQPRARVLT